jgi:hypothetical protein
MFVTKTTTRLEYCMKQNAFIQVEQFIKFFNKNDLENTMNNQKEKQGSETIPNSDNSNEKSVGSINERTSGFNEASNAFEADYYPEDDSVEEMTSEERLKILEDFDKQKPETKTLSEAAADALTSKTKLQTR